MRRGRDFINTLGIPKGQVPRGWGQAVFGSVQQQDKGHELECRKFHVNMRIKFFTLRTTAVEQVAQRRCEVCFPGDIKNLPEHFPVQPT